MEIKYERVRVTPELALTWLKMNTENNRLPKSGKIPAYARDMAAGKWNPNTGETIKFDVKGELIDGQNRLRAVVLANCAIEFDVAYHVPTEAMQVIDSGATRTLADVLIIGGAGGVRMTAASTVRWHFLWQRGEYMGGGKISPTHAELMEMYLSDPATYDSSAKRGADLSSRGLCTARVGSMAYLLFRELDSHQAVSFTDSVLTGANIGEGHPALTLRNKLIRRKLERLSQPEQLVCFIRAWNAFRKDRELHAIQMTRQGELTNANFPMPI